MLKEPGRSMGLTGIRLWGKAYLLTERTAVGNRTCKYVLTLFKRRGPSLAHTEGLAALQRQLQHASGCQFSEIHRQLLQAKENQCLSKNPQDD